MIIHRKILRNQERASEKAAGGMGEWGKWCTEAGNFCQALLCNCSPESSGFSLNIRSIRAWAGNSNINVVHQHLRNGCLKSPRALPACEPSPSQPSPLGVVVPGHFKGEGETHLENCCIFIIRPSITPVQDGIENIWCPGSGCFFF